MVLNAEVRAGLKTQIFAGDIGGSCQTMNKSAEQFEQPSSIPEDQESIVQITLTDSES